MVVTAWGRPKPGYIGISSASSLVRREMLSILKILVVRGWSKITSLFIARVYRIMTWGRSRLVTLIRLKADRLTSTTLSSLTLSWDRGPRVLFRMEHSSLSCWVTLQKASSSCQASASECAWWCVDRNNSDFWIAHYLLLRIINVVQDWEQGTNCGHRSSGTQGWWDARHGLCYQASTLSLTLACSKLKVICIAMVGARLATETHLIRLVCCSGCSRWFLVSIFGSEGFKL